MQKGCRKAPLLNHWFWLLFAADIHKNTLIGFGIPLFAGIPFNDRILALFQCVGKFCILRQLIAKLALHTQQFLLFGTDGNLIMNQANKQIAAQS